MNPDRKYFFIIAFVFFCIVLPVLGILCGDKVGHNRGVFEVSRYYTAIIQEKDTELQDLTARLEDSLARIQHYVERKSFNVLASWYGEESGTHMANGELFDPDRFTGAHWDFPFGTILFVENTKNNKFCFLIIQDRGPAKRIVERGITLDVSRGVAERLGMVSDGIAVLRVRILT